MTLQGKRAIVLGGSSGIGLAATNQLASEGATVIAASRQPQRAQRGGDARLTEAVRGRTPGLLCARSGGAVCAVCSQRPV